MVPYTRKVYCAKKDGQFCAIRFPEILNISVSYRHVLCCTKFDQNKAVCCVCIVKEKLFLFVTTVYIDDVTAATLIHACNIYTTDKGTCSKTLCYNMLLPLLLTAHVPLLMLQYCTFCLAPTQSRPVAVIMKRPDQAINIIILHMLA